MTDVKELRDLIERLRELEGNATPAPWQRGVHYRDNVVDADGNRILSNDRRAIDAIFADTTFIAETRNALPELLSALQSLVDRNEKLEEALRPFAESLVAQIDVSHPSQDWRDETDNTVVYIGTSHQRKGMPELSPDMTLWVGAFRRARSALPPEAQS